MANKVKQFRFYNDAEARKGDASNNSPKTAEKAQFVDVQFSQIVFLFLN